MAELADVVSGAISLSSTISSASSCGAVAGDHRRGRGEDFGKGDQHVPRRPWRDILVSALCFHTITTGSIRARVGHRHLRCSRRWDHPRTRLGLRRVGRVTGATGARANAKFVPHPRHSQPKPSVIGEHGSIHNARPDQGDYGFTQVANRGSKAFTRLMSPSCPMCSENSSLDRGAGDVARPADRG